MNGLLALLKSDSDPNRPYFAYSDRASIYEGMADGCSYNSQKSAEVCFRLFDLAKTDYSKARDLATQNGLPYFARISEEGIQRLNLLRNLTEMRQSALSKIPATVRFDPKSPKDVLVTEFISTGQVSPQAFQAVNAYRQAAGRALPGYLGIWVQAQMDEMQGRTDAALEGYLRAIQTVEEDRRKLGEDSARSAFLNDKIDIYDRPIRFLLKSKRYAEAFDLLERSRARATMDLLSTRSLGLSKPVDRKLFATLALKRAEIASLQTHFFNEALSSENQADDPQSVMRRRKRIWRSWKRLTRISFCASRARLLECGTWPYPGRCRSKTVQRARCGRILPAGLTLLPSARLRRHPDSHWAELVSRAQRISTPLPIDKQSRSPAGLHA